MCLRMLPLCIRTQGMMIGSDQIAKAIGNRKLWQRSPEQKEGPSCLL